MKAKGRRRTPPGGRLWRQKRRSWGREGHAPYPHRGADLKDELNIPPELVSAIVDGVVARFRPILTGLQTNPHRGMA